MSKRFQRKYLDELGVTGHGHDVSAIDPRQCRWQTQRRTYGFDERDTWDLSRTMVELLYERVLAFREFSPDDLTAASLTWNGVLWPQCDLVEAMLTKCRRIIISERIDASVRHDVSDVWNMWAVLSDAMWW